ncbi:MAG: DNA alkylation repair protein [Succinivibrio sp.]|nr:DNA alkylation repair protein [Succinivibrio sp.]
MNLADIKTHLAALPRTKFGIAIPQLRKLAVKIAREDYQELLERNDFSSFELKLLHAFVIGYLKTELATSLRYFKEFIPRVDDWAVNDSLCQNFRAARRHQAEVWDFLMGYKNSTQEFESRVVSVTLLSHYLNDEYLERVIEVLDRLNTERYYAQMGVAWTLATVVGKYPERGLEYLKSPGCHLDEQTYRRTLQKIRESYRVDDKLKAEIRLLKERGAPN